MTLIAEISDTPRKFALLVLRAYKRFVSPLFLPACRYVPSCSEYAAEAVENYGVLRGSMLAAWRLLRCHPFAHGGFDPVPALTTQQRTTYGPRRGTTQPPLGCNH